MQPDPDELGELADAVLEGRPLDWQQVESSAPAGSRDLISQFRTIARIADVRKRVANDPPEWWGHLKIQERLGAGAFGEVFRAWDSRLEREVALKLLNSDRDPTAILREARLLARIRHPNIVTVFDAAEFEGRAGFWMEFIQGQTLEEAVHDRGPFPAQEVLKLAIELCGALAAVHAAGLLHRDVKAQNVIRTADGRVVLMDFGAGDELASLEPVSQQSVGTPLYLAPEVLSGGPATPLSEIYSLGVLLFRVATGTYPVHSGTIDALRASHEQGSRKRILDVTPHFPRDLALVIDRAIDPDAGRRFETASAMEAALAAASADGRLHRTPRGTHRLMTVAAAILIAAVAVLAWTNWRIPAPVSEPLREADLIVPQVPPEFSSTVQSANGDVLTANKPLPATESRVTLQMVNAELQRHFNFRALADDGVHATCTPWGGSAVAICELATGAVQELRRPAAPDERAADAQLSPNGARVAYQWTDRSGTSLRLINVDRTEDREIYRPPTGRGFRLIKWIREGRAVLLAVSGGARDGNLLAVTIDGGRTEQVWQFNEPDTGRDLSPDERFVVFSRPATGQTTLDIAIVDTRTGEESWLVQNPSDDSKPLWTPDGRAVAFLSERLGPSGLFMLPVHEGRPAGDAVLVRDFGRSSVVPVNFARDGTMFFKMTTHWTDAFRAVMDLEKGVIGAPTRVDTRSIEETASPDCSPDGRRYAYVSGPMGRALTTTARLLVHYADGRLEREVPLDKVMRRVSILRWSPDGRHIAVRMANDVDSGAVVDLVDLDNNASRPLLRGVTNNFEWSADGSALYYSDGRQILRYDIATAVTTTVLSGPYVFDVSPQDGSIAVALPLNGCTVWVLAPGEPVRMSEVRATLRDSCLAVAWSRDGQKLLVSTLKSPDPPVDLYVMDAGGGDPIHLIVPTEAINSISLGPGNRDLLFSAGNPAPEFWTLRGVGSPAKVTTMAPTPAIR